MQIPILIEPIADGRFRAQTGEPFAAIAEGATEAEAAQLVEQVLLERFRRGARVALVNLPNGEPESASDPITVDDLYKSNWIFRAMQDEIEENRRLENEAEFAPKDSTHEAP